MNNIFKYYLIVLFLITLSCCQSIVNDILNPPDSIRFQFYGEVKTAIIYYEIEEYEDKEEHPDPSIEVDFNKSYKKPERIFLNESKEINLPTSEFFEMSNKDILHLRIKPLGNGMIFLDIYYRGNPLKKYSTNASENIPIIIDFEYK